MMNKKSTQLSEKLEVYNTKIKDVDAAIKIGEDQIDYMISQLAMLKYLRSTYEKEVQTITEELERA